MSATTQVIPEAGEEVATTAEFSTVDYVLFVLMLVMSLGIGVYSAIKGKVGSSTHQYLLGGRNMAPIPVAFSLIGGVFSAVSILGES